MSATLESLGIDRLPFEERLSLAHELWDSIFAEARPVMTEARRLELERRAADADAHPESGVPWREAEAQLLARLHKP